MELLKGSCYYPIEDLFYPFSLFDDSQGAKNTHPKNVISRLEALADLLECIVFSTCINFEHSEYGNDNKLVEYVINEYSLSDAFNKIDPVSMNLFELSPYSANMFINSLESMIDSDSNLDYINEIKKDLELKGSEQVNKQLLDTIQDNNLRLTKNKLTNIIDHQLINYSTIWGDKPQQDEIIILLALKCAQYALEYCEYSEPYNFDIESVEHRISKDNLYDLSTVPPAIIRKILTNLNTKLPELISGISITYFGGVETSIAVSAKLKLPYFPTRVSSSFILNTPPFAPASKVFHNKITAKKYDCIYKYTDFIYDKYTRTIQMPLLFNYVLAKSNSINDIFDVALGLRDSKEARKYRQWCTELDDALKAGAEQEAIRMIEAADDYIDAIAAKTNQNKNLSLQISMPPAIIFDINNSLLSNSRHLVFLRTLYKESTTPYKLSDKIQSIFNVSL